MTCKTFFALLLVITPSLGYFSFRFKVPNGDKVPHPCKDSVWKGIGHTNPDGGGENNQFGKDFYEAGKQWNDALCRHDSDGDGRSNGEELGDPDCTWKEGGIPDRDTDITHPGICDPIGEGVCAGRDTYVECDAKDFNESCAVIKNPDVKSIDYRFSSFEVPDTETNYFCQFFDLPSDGEYHLVADEGLIDQEELVHHMLLYGCPDDYQSSPTDDYPNPCSMSGSGRSCNILLSLWSLGYKGNCNSEDMGYKIGVNGYKKVKLEIHYNNPMMRRNYRDTSGLRLYYQPAKPGVQDLATLAVGQTMLRIPPGKSEVEFHGSCPGDCTQSIITKPLYVVSTINHMHYLGKSQKTQVFRDGKVVKVLADDAKYDYDSPIMHKLDEPFEVLPGDEIATTCTYDSTSKDRFVFYGDATNDEMCFAFIVLYPYDALPYTKWCTMQGPLSPCDLFAGTPKHGCDWKHFTNISNPDMLEHYRNVDHNCDLGGVCRPECKQVVEEIMKHECMGEKMKPVISNFMLRYYEGAKFIGKLHSCEGHHEKVDCKHECEHTCKHDHDGVDDHWEANTGSTILPAMFNTAAILVTSFIFARRSSLF